MSSIPQTQQCTICLKEKPLDEFPKNYRMASGHLRQCGECHKQKRRDETARITAQNRLSPHAIDIAEQRCTRCKQTLPINNFSQSVASKTRFHHECKNCKKAHRPGEEYPRAAFRVCPSCHKKKPGGLFIRHKRSPDGLQGKCKPCRKRQSAATLIPANKYCAKCKNVLPSSAFYKNRALSTGLSVYCKTCDVHRPASPAAKKAAYNRYIARKRGNGGSFTARQWTALCAYYGGVCLRCGTQKRLTADHVKPLFYGGTSDISNIQPLCLSCNDWKSTKDIDFRPDGGMFASLL